TNGSGVKFAQRPVEGARPSPTAKAERLILDGQQRTTALFQALLMRTPVQTQDVRKKPLTVWFYVDIQKALDPQADREDAILVIPEEKQVKTFRGEIQLDLSTPEAEYERLCFPLNQLFHYEDWEDGFE